MRKANRKYDDRVMEIWAFNSRIDSGLHDYHNLLTILEFIEVLCEYINSFNLIYYYDLRVKWITINKSASRLDRPLTASRVVWKSRDSKSIAPSLYIYINHVIYLTLNSYISYDKRINIRLNISNFQFTINDRKQSRNQNPDFLRNRIVHRRILV